jgi:hypothetical protein
VTTIVGALFLFLLPPLKTFQFATSEQSASDMGRLLQRVAINLLPEVLIDSWCIFTETEGGLGPAHVQYWKQMSLGTVFTKAFICLCVTPFVLGACVVPPLG